MNTVIKQSRDKDLVYAEVALRLAAKRAKMIAEQTNTPLVVYEGGHIVKKLPGKRRSKQA